MVKIVQAGYPHAFKLTFSPRISRKRGFSVYVKSSAEVHVAIDHYYGTGKKVHLGGEQRRICPLCRKMREDVSRAARS